MTSPRIWFITGANRGIGLEIARAALAAGDHVVATARRKQSVIDALGERDDVLALALDVTDKQQIAAAVDAATTRFGRIDILVNNAGYGHLGLFEQTTDAEVRMQFNTNVFGLMDVTRAVLPVMRAQRSGHVLNLSSVTGIAGFAMASLYCASKFAVEGFSLSLAEEVKQFGIHVTLVAPVFTQKPYFLSDEFSLVDCYLAPLLWRLPVLGVELVGAGAKELKGYMTRVFERDSFLASLTEAEREMRLGRG